MFIIKAVIILVLFLAVIHADGSICQDNPKYKIKCEQYWSAYCHTESKHWPFMLLNCKKTCGICSDASTCKNNPQHSEDCDLHWSGYCKSTSQHWSFMQMACKRSCGFCGDCGLRSAGQDYVIGGVEAEAHSWPWSVALLRFGENVCGGSLIDEEWVLTAAQCVFGREDQAAFTQAVLGEHNRIVDEKSEQKFRIAKIIRHANYSSKTLDNDIAMIKLKRKVTLKKDSYGNPDKIGLVCLPKQGETPNPNDLCYITGWGRTKSEGPISSVLMEAEMPVVTNDVCSKHNTRTGGTAITKNMLCAGQKPGTVISGCHGDLGGPFVCNRVGRKWTLFGSVSWGSLRCDRSEKYTVFARVSEFRNWIDGVMKSN